MEEMIPISMFMCIAAVMILRPLTKQLGRFLEVLTEQRLKPAIAAREPDHDSTRITVLLEHMVRKMDAMEERLDFTERLMSSQSSQRTAPQLSTRELSVRDLPDVGLRQEPLHSAFR